MKFGKDLGKVIEMSDPEWWPFWINYKYLKKRIKAIDKARRISTSTTVSNDSNNNNDTHLQMNMNNNETTTAGHTASDGHAMDTNNSSHSTFHSKKPTNNIPFSNVNKYLYTYGTQQHQQQNIPANNNNNNSELIIAKIPCEVEFFKELKHELREMSTFFESLENQYSTRHDRIFIGYTKLTQCGYKYDKSTWSRLLKSCVNLYKDVLQLEHFAVTNYCGYSKILKKHDKVTGFATREAFMRNVINNQNFTYYPKLIQLIKQSENLYLRIQDMDQSMPLHEEERLFIDVIRGMNRQAYKRKFECEIRDSRRTSNCRQDTTEQSQSQSHQNDHHTTSSSSGSGSSHSSSSQQQVDKRGSEQGGAEVDHISQVSQISS